MAEIEAEVRHDVIAFLTNVNEHVGDAGRYIHLGLTSSDVLDTGLALQLVASLTLIQEQLEYLIQAVRHRAQEHRYTVMVGRSHGIHAEPITFGFKLAGWLAELLRHRDRLCQLQRTVAVGKNFRSGGHLCQCGSARGGDRLPKTGTATGYGFNTGHFPRSPCRLCPNPCSVGGKS